MKLSELRNIASKIRSKQTDRFTFIIGECEKLAIPFGPRFQAEVPSWTYPFTRTYLTTDLDNSKWLGSPVWPAKGKIQTANNLVGRGRSDICECEFPGSTECVRKHVSSKRIQLQADLGPAFWKWKFDDMGDDISRLWCTDEEKTFDYVVKANPTSQGRNFLKSALEFLPGQSKGSVVNYYLNVYIPRRISIQTRSSCTTVDTDDDTEDTPRVKGSRKRLQGNCLTSSSIRVKYLATRCRDAAIPRRRQGRAAPHVHSRRPERQQGN